VDIFQPCVTFNRINSYEWFREHTYFLEDAHPAQDRAEAFRRAIETKKLPLGIFYVNPEKPVFEDQLAAYRSDRSPLFRRSVDLEKLKALIDHLRKK
jgi:2-oxoglutarate ferredoxin oxidoreductase subunit beta